MTDLASAIAHGRETTTIDFKARLAWQTGRAAQMAVVRDLVGLANREGGAVVIGVSDRGDGSFDFTGLAVDDTLPDPTELNTLLRDYFDPAISVGLGPRMEAGVTFGVIEVPVFRESPLIATRDFQAGAVRLADGDLLVRTDALTTERMKGRDLRAVLDRAISTRQANLGALLPTVQAPAASVRSDDWSEGVSGSRLLELEPGPGAGVRSLRDVESMVTEATVESRTGMTAMPPGLPLGGYGTRMIRETGRVIAQASTSGAETADDLVSTAEITTGLRVRIREVPWERGTDSWVVPERESRARST